MSNLEAEEVNRKDYAPGEELDRLVDEAVILPDAPSQSPQLKTAFRPWHKPRKQYVRKFQWVQHISDLVENPNLDIRSRPLRYLSLPGDELLDIRIIHQEICVKNKINILFFGYNDAQGKALDELHISLNEVRALPFVHQQFSNVIPDQFESITNEKSKAYIDTRKLAPYDVINLDFCDSVFKRPPLQQGTNLEALRTLIDLQQKGRGDEPWILFLTTRIGSEHMHTGVKVKLFKLLLNNYQKSSQFGAKINDLFNIQQTDIESEIDNDKSKLDHIKFVNCFGLGFCKWLIALLNSVQPPWSVKLLDGYSYQIGPLNPDLFSLAFRFDKYPSVTQDHTGLTRGNETSPEIPKEIDQAIAIIERISKICNIDLILAKDESVKKQMKNETYALLVNTRYDPQKAHDWLDKQ